MAAKARVAKAKSSTFFCATLIAFLVLTDPASSSMKPICMIITRVAAMITQIMSSVPASAATSAFPPMAGGVAARACSLQHAAKAVSPIRPNLDAIANPAP